MLLSFCIQQWTYKKSNYFTSSDPHHDMLGGGCQVRVVIKNMMGRMENLRTLISGFLGLVILVRWALVTMFLSWTTQTGCRIHRTYVSLIGSGEGRHTTHLLKCVLLLSTSQTDWKQSSDVLSDISFDMLSDISSDILSDISKPKPNIHSFTKKPLCKLYIYLAPRSKSNIHDNFVPVNVIALSASDRPAKRQLSPKMQNACSSTHTHTPHASDRPAKRQLSPKMQKSLKCHNYISWRVQTMKSDARHCGACAGSAKVAPLRTLFVSHSCTPSSQNEAEVRKTAARFSSSCSPSAFGTGLPSYATYHLFPSTTSSMINIKSPACVVLGRSMHTYMRSAPNKGQLVAPHMLNSFGNLIGSPNEDRLRTFHHNLRHGFQTKLTSLHKNKVEPTVLYLLQYAK